MKVSLNWAQYYSNVDLKSIPRDVLLHKIGSQLGAIEEVIDYGPRYDGIFVAKIMSVTDHPNADKLHICMIDDGGAVKDADRNQDGLVQVVCGAPNVRVGMLVAWLPPGSTVPSTLAKEPYVLGARDLRGVISNGMLASAKELGINEDHEGILEINPQEVGGELAVVGTPFKQLYGLDDLVIDCENKMFTHRPDCFGILGVARELAGITGQRFVSPSWYLDAPVTKRRANLEEDLKLNVTVTTELVPRFMAQVIQGITVAPSQIWIQAGLGRVGIRPINNVVDISNCFMQWTAQPTHAFDYDKIKALSGDVVTLGARMAVDGEVLALLNGKTIKLTKNDIVIATDKKAVSLAGVMGGSETEVDANTKNIIIECATFDMYTIRRTAMRHGIFTDAVTRFNKGQSPLQNDRVLAEVVKDIINYAGGQTASDVIDIKSDQVVPMPTVTAPIDFINSRLGSSLSVDEAQQLLENVECLPDAGMTLESRSYLTGVGNIDEKLIRVGIKIVEKTEKGNYKLLIPFGSENDYEKLVSWELKPGFWNEYLGAKNVFLFKDTDQKISRYEVNDDNEREIVETCRLYANDYFTSLDGMLSANEWYKPLLPLKKNMAVETYDANTVVVSPPFWRRDLELSEDLVEEIGRLYGFDKLPVSFPARSAEPVKKDPELTLARKLRNTLKRAGANELLTYSFVHNKLFDAVGQNKDLAFHIRNALSPDLQYYRLSITPSLLDKVHMNVRAGYDDFTVFEIGKTHNKVHAVLDGEVPEEYKTLALVTVDNNKEKSVSGSPFYKAKAYLDFLASNLSIQLTYMPINEMPDYPVTKPFDVSRSAFVGIANTPIVLGIIGEYRPQVIKALKLPQASAGFEIGLADLLAVMNNHISYIPAGKYPSVQQDVTFEVSKDLNYVILQLFLESHTQKELVNHGYTTKLEPIGIFKAEESDMKRISFHLTIAHPDRTLTTDEVNKFLEELAKKAAQEIAAVRI